jgi:hypothetical protein
MGRAELIVFSEVRARTQGQRRRDTRHARLDQWLERLAERLPDPTTSWAEGTDAVWQLRQDRTGGLSETMIAQVHVGARTRQSAPCPPGGRRLQTRSVGSRRVETMGGPVHVACPDFYGPAGCGGVYPLDEAVALVPGCQQLDVQKAAAQLAV